MTPSINFAWDQGPRILPLDLARFFRDECRIDGIRYLWDWSLGEPERGKYDFSFADETMNNATKAGLRVQFNPYFIPAWATGGFACMNGYDNACNKNAVALPDEGDSARCYNAVDINPQAAYNLGSVLESRYGATIDSYGVFNEHGVKTYWLTERNESARSGSRRWYDILAAPFCAGVTKISTRVRLVAQFDEFCDSAYTTRLDTLGYLDEIGIHPYNDVRVGGEQGLIAHASSVSRLAAHHDRLALRAPSAHNYRRDMRAIAELAKRPALAPHLIAGNAATPKLAGRRIFTALNPVTGEPLDTFDIDAGTDAVIEMVNVFHERLDPYLAGRKMAIPEIQHCDIVRLARTTGMDVTDHDPMRYVNMILQWYHNETTGRLDLRIVPKSGKWELTEEGRLLQQALSTPHHRRGV